MPHVSRRSYGRQECVPEADRCDTPVSESTGALRGVGSHVLCGRCVGSEQRPPCSCRRSAQYGRAAGSVPRMPGLWFRRGAHAWATGRRRSSRRQRSDHHDCPLPGSAISSTKGRSCCRSATRMRYAPRTNTSGSRDNRARATTGAGSRSRLRPGSVAGGGCSTWAADVVSSCKVRGPADGKSSTSA
jgi:hypothetical protein